MKGKTKTIILFVFSVALALGVYAFMMYGLADFNDPNNAGNGFRVDDSNDIADREPGYGLIDLNSTDYASIGRAVGKRPGELKKQSTKPFVGSQGFYARFELIDIFLRDFFSLMGENLVKLDCKKELRESVNPLDPGQGDTEYGRPVECAVYLDNIDVAG